MSDNFVTCRHCGIGINYACDHSDDDVPQEDVESLVEAAWGLTRFVRHNERCSVWAVGAPACDCGLAVSLGAFATAFVSALDARKPDEIAEACRLHRGTGAGLDARAK